MEFFSNAPYFSELLTVIILAVVIAITPGLDFMLVTRNSVLHSRDAGVFSAIGVGLSLWVHVAYSIAGLAAIISQSVFLFWIIKYLGAAYLVYIGWKTLSLRAEQSVDLSLKSKDSAKILGRFAAFRMGFFCNLLNPKAPIFFLSIFTQIVNPETPLLLQVAYGAIISIVHIIWFSLVAIFLSQPAFGQKYNLYKGKIDNLVGILLIGFGIKMASTSQ